MQVFADPFALSTQDREVAGEARWQTVGMAAGVVVLLVAHTVRDEEMDEIVRIHLRPAGDAQRERFL